jgi:uncharacterized protein (DUF58 family)
MTNAEQPRAELSQRGAVVLGGSIVAFVVGMARADGALASLALLGFLLVPLANWLGKRNMRGLVLDCQAAHRGTVGQKFPVRFFLRRSHGTASATEVRARFFLPGGGRHDCRFARMESGTVAALEQCPDLKQRGETPRLLYQLSSLYPLGLWKQELSGFIDHALSVAPRPVVSKKLTLSGLWREGVATAGMSYATNAGEIRGLRAWRAGDSLKRIHPAASARSFARGMSLMVAETDPPGFSPRHVTVMFHSYAADRAIIRPEMFERALGYLAGTLRYLWQQSMPATLIADFDGWLEQSCRNRRELHELSDHLARVRRQASTELHELQRIQAQVDPQSSLIVISDMPSEHWRPAIIRREIPTLILPVHLVASRRHSPPTKR